MPEITATDSPTPPIAEPSIQEQTEGASAPVRAKPGEGSVPDREKYIKVRAPEYYWEVLSLIPPHLMRRPAAAGGDFENVEFFLDVIEAYLPKLEEEIEEVCWCEGGDKDACDRRIAVRMGTVTGMRHIIEDMRTLLNIRHCHATESIAACYRALIEEFERAHGEKFYCDWTKSVARGFRAWKLGLYGYGSR